MPIQDFRFQWLPFTGVDKTALAPLTSVQNLVLDVIALQTVRSLGSPLQSLTLVSVFPKFPRVLHNATFQVLSKFGTSLTNLNLYFPIRRIENDTFMWIPNLRILFLWSNKIQTLSKNSFRGLTALQQLDLSDNVLTAVPSDTFNAIGKFESLQFLDLSSNSIFAIADDAFVAISSLKYLNVENNELQDRFVYTRWLSFLPNLHHLVLGNFGSYVSAVTILALTTPLLSLRIFEIRNANLVNFESSVCLTFPNLRSFVASDVVVGLNAYRLALHECSLLKELYLSNSLDLKQIDVSISTLEHLSPCSLSKNKLESTGQILFIKAPNLTLLNVSDNQIRTIGSEIAHAFKRLIYFYINSNAVVSLTGLEQLTFLKHLDIGRNQITEVPPWLISTTNTPNLITLDLSENPFSCTCEIEKFRKWIVSDTNTWLQPGQHNCAILEGLKGISISDIKLDCRSFTAFYIGISIPLVVEGIAGLVVWYLASGAQGPRINTRLGHSRLGYRIDLGSLQILNLIGSIYWLN